MRCEVCGVVQAFLLRDDDFGDLCYFCDVSSHDGYITVTPRDSYHRTVYISELGLQIRSDAGTIARVEVQRDEAGSSVTSVVVVFDPVGDQPLSRFRLRLLTRSGSRVFSAKGLEKARGGYDVTPSEGGTTQVELAW